MEENERNTSNWFSGCYLNKQLTFVLTILCLSSALAGKLINFYRSKIVTVTLTKVQNFLPFSYKKVF